MPGGEPSLVVVEPPEGWLVEVLDVLDVELELDVGVALRPS